MSSYKAIELGSRIKTAGSYYKSMYPLTRDGELIAFLTFRHGWGQAWSIAPLQNAAPYSKDQFEGVQPNDYLGLFCSKKENAPGELGLMIERYPDRFKTLAELKDAKRLAKEKDLSLARARLQELRNKYADLSNEVDSIGTALRCMNGVNSASIDHLRHLRDRLADEANAYTKLMRNQIKTIEGIEKQHSEDAVVEEGVQK